MEGNALELPPRGHYLANEVGRLAGVSGRAIGQWARRGYIRSSQSADRPRVYSFQDIAEAMIVHELLELGVPHREIKSAIHALRAERGSAWPLQDAHAQEPLRVTVRQVGALRPPAGLPRPGSTESSRREPPAYLLAHDGVRYVRPAEDLDQGVLDINTAEVTSDLRRGGWAARSLRDLSHIEVDPDRLSGRPTIRGRRVAAEDVACIALVEGGREDLHEGYDLSDDEIDDAVRWWNEVTEYEAAA
jgi:DNA-binding transcriptional MerR regulator/uncharacterized protein (DUF433 family)